MLPDLRLVGNGGLVATPTWNHAALCCARLQYVPFQLQVAMHGGLALVEWPLAMAIDTSATSALWLQIAFPALLTACGVLQLRRLLKLKADLKRAEVRKGPSECSTQSSTTPAGGGPTA